ncbi:hypothetical protein HK103_003566 [Boothiomyces macroporosus]|uniref:Myb-like domain-containing protein n=1 Tax=Boothiomyces macroporosus TaxID=261099 RepID=A0AAD5UHP0_9FUNG|nr:hypothetical protein HK103_003566 [Boothiomyces macroporosus]
MDKHQTKKWKENELIKELVINKYKEIKDQRIKLLHEMEELKHHLKQTNSFLFKISRLPKSPKIDIQLKSEPLQSHMLDIPLISDADDQHMMDKSFILGKKGKWTNKELKELKYLVDLTRNVKPVEMSDWQRISNQLQRPVNDCILSFDHSRQVKQIKYNTSWTEQESHKLRVLYQYLQNDWKTISTWMNKSPKQCFNHYAKIDLVKGRWTVDQDEKLVELYRKYQDVSKVQHELKYKSTFQVKQRLKRLKLIE